MVNIGFRNSHSCESAIHEIVSDCLKNMDLKLINLLLFIDFKKAFDMIDQDLLLYKLANYGLSNNALSLMINYFSNRSQMTKINGIESSFVDLKLGVPQGSVLGPLLFIIFINDMPYFLNDILTKLFADDTTLLFHGKDIASVTSSLIIGLKALNEWCKHNRLYINWSKTFIMFITNKRVVIPKFIDYENVRLLSVTQFKLLGVIIDDKLDFQSFTAQTCLNINRKLYSINRLFYLPFSVKLQFFKAFILPYFDYGLSLSIYFHKTAIRKLCKMYYICLKKLFNFSFLDKTQRFGTIQSHEQINKSLKEYNLFSFHHRLVVRLLLFINKILFLTNAPKQLKEWLVLNNKQVSGVCLRSDYAKNFKIEKTLTKFGDLTFSNFFSRLLNMLKFNEFNSCLIKFKNDRLLNLKIHSDLSSLLKLFPRFNCELNSYFLFL